MDRPVGVEAMYRKAQQESGHASAREAREVEAAHRGSPLEEAHGHPVAIQHDVEAPLVVSGRKGNLVDCEPVVVSGFGSSTSPTNTPARRWLSSRPASAGRSVRSLVGPACMLEGGCGSPFRRQGTVPAR